MTNMSPVPRATGLAVVTGAASGIGAALAERLAQRGTRLVLGDINHEGLQVVAARLGATAVTVDVSDANSVERLAAMASDADLVCLNAGVISAEQGPPWEASPQEWSRVLSINVGGVVN